MLFARSQGRDGERLCATDRFGQPQGAEVGRVGPLSKWNATATAPQSRLRSPENKVRAPERGGCAVGPVMSIGLPRRSGGSALRAWPLSHRAVRAGCTERGGERNSPSKVEANLSCEGGVTASCISVDSPEAVAGEGGGRANARFLRYDDAVASCLGGAQIHLGLLG